MIPPVLERPDITPRVKEGLLKAGGIFKLNLGGVGPAEKKIGKIPGFLTVDIQDTPNADIVSDCADLSIFEDNSVSEIYASNILEHWPHTQTIDVLKEWHRVLIPKGSLWISVPDMDAALRLVAIHGLVQGLVNIIWGDQIHAYAYHYINFSFASLSDVCCKAGFSDIKRRENLPYGLRDASTNRDNFSKLPVSLNVEVTK